MFRFFQRPTRFFYLFTHAFVTVADVCMMLICEYERPWTPMDAHGSLKVSQICHQRRPWPPMDAHGSLKVSQICLTGGRGRPWTCICSVFCRGALFSFAKPVAWTVPWTSMDGCGRSVDGLWTVCGRSVDACGRASMDVHGRQKTCGRVCLLALEHVRPWTVYGRMDVHGRPWTPSWSL
jgi:hypothetical protein